ncbi:MAG: hypothetical protein OXC18_24880 [Desulfurellaceae bacterium]|nr:hypothetical protein [Desulfurellaceae bacterium]
MTRLSWNEICARAAAFAEEWQDAAYEKGETQSFYNDFFNIFGVKRRTVARYEEHVKKLDNRSGFIDLFWPGVLLVEQKSAGRDLTKASRQADDYFDALPEQDRPHYILVSDFQTFELRDRDERERAFFALADLPHNVEKFGFILGVQKPPSRIRTRSTFRRPNSWATCTTRSNSPATPPTTSNAFSSVPCSACLPTIPASSSDAASR